MSAFARTDGRGSADVQVLNSQTLEILLCLFSFRLYCSHLEKKTTQILTLNVVCSARKAGIQTREEKQ